MVGGSGSQTYSVEVYTVHTVYTVLYIRQSYKLTVTNDDVLLLSASGQSVRKAVARARFVALLTGIVWCGGPNNATTHVRQTSSPPTPPPLPHTHTLATLPHGCSRSPSCNDENKI